MNQAVRGTGYALLASQIEIDPTDPTAAKAIHRALGEFLSARVDGIIVSTSYLGIEELLEHIWESLPVVILAGHSGPYADTATVDSYQAGVEATDHLIVLGHRRILHVAGPDDRNEGRDRARGYHDALARVGMAPLPIIRGDWSADSGFDVGLRIDPATFTAVFCGNDQMALGFMSALRDRGLVAPDDYSIVGVDDMPDARYFTPPLTSMWMDFAALGRVGLEMLLERLHTAQRVPRRVIAPQLVVRRSTAQWDESAAHPPR
jgi:DNA-binding LacI/PurR family transcriptional regulator